MNLNNVGSRKGVAMSHRSKRGPESLLSVID